MVVMMCKNDGAGPVGGMLERDEGGMLLSATGVD